MSSSTLSWYSINNTGDVLTFSGEKFQVEGDVDITGGYYINGELVMAGGSQLQTLGEVLPVGSFINFPWPSSPSDADIPYGFLRCNGAEISNIIYSELYAVLGNRYGTPSSIYGFVLPNFTNLIIKYRTTATPSSSDLLPIGSIFTIPWTINPYPIGFLKCDGSEVSREEYNILFTEIGDIYGAGDGSTTFNLPNLFNQGIKYRNTIISSSGTTADATWKIYGDYLYFEDRVGIGTVAPRKNLDVVGTSIFTGGNVGMGTTNPAANLDIRTVSGIGPELRLSETSESYSRISFYGTTGSTYFHVSSLISTTESTDALCRLDLNVGSGNLNVMSLMGSQRAGIGTTNPNYKLHVVSNIGETWDNYNTSIYTDKTVVADSFYARGTETGTKASYFGGRVGIGTTDPLVGTLYVANRSTAPLTAANIYIHDEKQGSSYVPNGWRLDHGSVGDNKFAIIQNGVAARMVFSDGGGVGIGTTAPGYPLDVQGDGYVQARVRSTNSAGHLIVEGSSFVNNGQIQLITKGGPAPYSHIFAYRNGAPDLLQVNGGLYINGVGRVGIGTTNPAFPLDVQGSVEFDFSGITNHYLYASGVGANWNPGRQVSIRATTSIWSQDIVIASSDSRIKKNISEIDDGKALSKLRLIQPTEYEYIDSIRKGKTRVFGFIAQQVREHFPEATNLMKEVVPDVYSLCLSNLDAQVIHLSGNARDGKLRLITKTRQLDVEVTAPSPDTVQLPEGTLTEEDLHEGKVFVYGYEVEDFHTLNKDYLFTINFAATQELDRKVQSLESEVQSLKTENLNLNARLTALEDLLKAQMAAQV